MPPAHGVIVIAIARPPKSAWPAWALQYDRSMRRAGLWLVVVLALAGCATGRASRRDLPAVKGAALTGQASWYGKPHHGRRTTSGEVYDMNKLTAAHRTLPFGTRVLVTNLDNG